MAERRIAYVSGTRADFGLMLRSLRRIRETPGLQLDLVVTGMHLSSAHGLTVREVEASGLGVAAQVEMPMASDRGAAAARALGVGLVGLADALERLRPDLVLLLGDRAEMMAGALSAVHLNIPVAHVHGGDRSGTVDDSLRQAITKLAHLHLTATEAAAQRVRALGEEPAHVFCVGAPGLDDIVHGSRTPAAQVCARLGADPRRPILLVLQHPVTQELYEAGEQMRITLDAVRGFDAQVVVGAPNSDPGWTAISECVAERAGRGELAAFTHLPREDFLGLLAGAAVLVGNSSAGVIEAASLGVPVVNVGTRQRLRERSGNVLDVPHDRERIAQAVRKALTDKEFLADVSLRRNCYGDGQTAERMVRILKEFPLDRALLYKGPHG